jgi:hypothetical protein
MSGDGLSKLFKSLYDAFADAIANKKPEWFQRHFAEDFLATSAPWPTLHTRKRRMIEVLATIETMEVEWSHVTAQQFGTTVLSTGVCHYIKEVFQTDISIGAGMPTGYQLSSLVNGKKVLYVGGWRFEGDRWQMFDYHMIGPLEGFR